MIICGLMQGTLSTREFGDTTDFVAIKKHYHIDCNPGNIHQIIAKGPDEEAWLLPHGREKLRKIKYKRLKNKKLSGYEGMLTRQLL